MRAKKRADTNSSFLFCSLQIFGEIVTSNNRIKNRNTAKQRWSQGHKALGQGQGHKKISRPRTEPLEAKGKDQGHRRKCSQKKKSSKNFFRWKRSLKTFFSGDLYLKKPNKKSLQIFCKVSGVFQRNFNGSKIVLSSSRRQGNFRGLEASRPRPRTSKCVLEDVLKAKDVLKDSISAAESEEILTCRVGCELMRSPCSDQVSIEAWVCWFDS